MICADALHPSQQNVSYAGMFSCLPGLKPGVHCIMPALPSALLCNGMLHYLSLAESAL